MTETSVTHMITNVRHLLEKHEEINHLNGSNFNVFSILKMESKENGTHSAFLAELLNPRGSHGLGDVFLRSFLKTIQYNSIDSFVTRTANVYTEFFIGAVDLEASEGGRIDIYIVDEHNQSLSIENKIYASDQPLQIKRYHNYNLGRNSVYYLNLDGTPPKGGSEDDLTSQSDFTVISYDDQIIRWLDDCVKEAANQPILRETIKQYLNLIKKLTHTMNEEQDVALKNVLLANLQEAEYIADNLPRVLEKSRADFREDLISHLNKELSDGFHIEKAHDTSHTWSKIWIKSKAEQPNITFGIEPFGGNKRAQQGGVIFIGLFGKDLQKDIWKDKGYHFMNDIWPAVHFIPSYEGTSINTANMNFMSAIQDTKTREKVLAHMTEEVIKFISGFTNIKWIENYLNDSKKKRSSILDVEQ